LKNDYLEAVDGIITQLVRTSPRRNLTYIGELKASSRDFLPKMDHFVCYLPGTLALGVRNGMPFSHMRLAEKLMDTCYHMYSDQPTFLSPENVYFSTKVRLSAYHIKIIFNSSTPLLMYYLYIYRMTIIKICMSI